MKHPVRAALSACLLLAFAGNAPAAEVSGSNGYVSALGNNESIVTVTQDTTLTAQTPANATVAPGFILEGAYSGSGPTVKLIGGTGSAMGFWASGADMGTIRNLTFENFIHTIPGHDAGAVYLEDGNISGGIHNVHFIGNTSQSHGGALFVYFVNPANSFSGGIHNSSFINNTSIRNGGGADINTGVNTPTVGDLTNNRIAGNTVLGLGPDWGLGGGMWIVRGLTGDMADNTVTGNQAKYGGGLALGNLTGNLTGNNVFTGNTADVHGGAIYVHDDFVSTLPQGFLTGNIMGASFTNNAATTGAGGALYTPTMTGTISGSAFTGNTAGDLGGAVYLGGGDISIVNTRFVGNESKVSGAGIYARAAASLMIADSAFIGNASTGENASAMYSDFVTGTGTAGYLRTNDLTLENLTVLGNTGNDAASGNITAAFVYVNPDANPSTVTVSATGGQTARFYGNRATDTGSHRALYFGHFDAATPVTTNVAMHADAGSRLLMLDAMKDNATAALTLNVSKTGAGDWYLGGESQMRAANTWNVQQGALVLTTVDYGAGEVAAHVNLSNSTTAVFNLDAGGTLAGAGGITAQTINLGGTIAPATWVNTGVKANALSTAITQAGINSIDVAKTSDFGTLNLTGTVTLAAGSSTVLDVTQNASLSDRINVTGDLDIKPGAALALRNGASHWTLNTPVILMAATGMLGGTFVNTNITYTGFDSLVFATPQVGQANGQVQLLLLRNGNPFASICQTHNQCAVAGAADLLPNTHPVADALGGLPLDTARRAYDNLSGEIYASTRAAMLTNRHLRDAVASRARRPDHDEKLWFSTWGFDGRNDGRRGIARTDQRGAGLALGADVLLGRTTVGAVLGYEDHTVKHGAGRNARAKLDAVSAGGYLASTIAGINLYAGALYSYLDGETERSLWVPQLQGKTKADTRSHKVQVFTELSQDFALGVATVTPYAGVAQTWLNSSTARESADGQASGARLTVQGGTDSVTQTTLGLRAAYQLPTTRLPATLYGDLAWSHAVGDVNNKTRNRFAGANNRYSIRGTGSDKNTALIGVGVQAQLGANAVLTLGYQGELGEKRKHHSASLQVRVGF